MTKWEYHLEAIDWPLTASEADQITFMNGRGLEGWELIRAQTVSGRQAFVTGYLWKRPINEERLIHG